MTTGTDIDLDVFRAYLSEVLGERVTWPIKSVEDVLDEYFPACDCHEPEQLPRMEVTFSGGETIRLGEPLDDFFEWMEETNGT